MTDKEKEQLQEAEQHRKNKLIHLTKTEKENLLKLEGNLNTYVLNYSNPTDLTGYATETWVSQQNYLTSYTELDPIFSASASAGITSQNIIDWNNKLSSYSETDPVFSASQAFGITSQNKTDWTTAFTNASQPLGILNSPTFTNLSTNGWCKVTGTFATNANSITAGVGNNQSFTDSSNAILYGIKNLLTSSNSNGTLSSMYSSDFSCTWSPTIQSNANRTLGSMYGGYANSGLAMNMSDTKDYTITDLANFRSGFTVQGAMFGGTARVTTMTHFFARTPYFPPTQAAVTTCYAFYDEGQVSAKITNPWGFYGKSVNNVIGGVTGGKLAIGKTTAPTVALDVTGAGAFTTTVTSGTGYVIGTTVGLATQVVALAPLTVGGTAGSLTISGGICTAYTAPT